MKTQPISPSTIVWMALGFVLILTAIFGTTGTALMSILAPYNVQTKRGGS